MQTNSAISTYLPPYASTDLFTDVGEAIGHSSGLFSAAFLLWLANFHFATPILFQSVGLLTSRLVVNLTSGYNLVPKLEMECVQQGAENLVRTYPNLRLVTFLFTLALSWLWVAGSMAVGFGLGVLGGLTIDRARRPSLAVRPCMVEKSAIETRITACPFI